MSEMFVHKISSATEMVEEMKQVAQQGKELTMEERKLLSVAYNNTLGVRYTSWRAMSCLEQKAKESDSDKVDMVKLTREYREEVEEELKNICDDAVKVVCNHLIPNTKDAESRVYYYKM